MTNSEWLESLKIGDSVYHETRHRKSIIKITNITKTQIVCGSSRFMRRNGTLIGSDKWSKSYILPVTEKVMQMFENLKLKRKLDEIMSKELTSTQMKSMIDAYNSTPIDQAKDE
jgi:hypothetical protein